MKMYVLKPKLLPTYDRLLSKQRCSGLLSLFSHKTVVILSMLGLNLAQTACMQNTMPDLAQPLPAHWQQQPQSTEQLPSPDLQGWWKAFHAPDLDALVEESLAQNLTLAAAREHIHAARILANKNSSNFLPDLHFRTDDVPSPSATSSFFQAEIDTSWELGLFGKKEASQQVADGQLTSVEAQAQMARVSLVAEVVRTWIRLRTAQQQTLLCEQLIQQSQQQYNLTLARVHLGLSPQSVLSTIQTSLAQQKKMEQEQQLEVDQALQQLALLQGRISPDPSWSVTTTLPVIGDFSVKTLPTDVIRIRPDIQQAQAEVLKAAGQFGMARAARYPYLNLSGSFIYSLAIVGHFILHSFDDNTIGAIGPVIDIPLFDWGLRKAAEDARGSELKAATLNYRQTVLTAVHEVESSLAEVRATKHQIDLQYQVMHAVKHTLKTNQALTNLGLLSPLEQLDEQQTAVQAQMEFSNLQMKHDLAYVAVYKALGGAPLAPSTSEQGS